MNIVRFKTTLLALCLGFVSSGAMATQEKLFAGVWVSNAKFCPLMEKIGTRAIFGNDIAIVTLERGFIGDEFFCSFDNISYGSDGKSVVISATCDDPGEQFRETIYLDRFDSADVNTPTRFEFNSAYITGQSRPGNGDENSRFLFARCDNLTEQMLIERTEP